MSAPDNPPQRVFESISCYDIGPWHIRVWRMEAQIGERILADVEHLIADLTDAYCADSETLTPKRILEELAALDNVSAVEVTSGGQGCLVYNDWP